MPYWIADTLAATPLFAWVFVGLGVPYALALLPRRDWHRRAEVIAVAFAIGPALLTAYMFALSAFGARYTWEIVFGGTVVIALIGAAWAWRKGLTPRSAQAEIGVGRLRPDEWVIIGLIGAALIVRWFVIAYWPFTAYDSLWVYGYEGRLYTLLGSIPNSIGYYPQFLPLQYTFPQLLFGINDHAARAGLIFLHAGSIFAAYVLGSRVFNRRVGLIGAAIWALHPHLGEWSRAGDLEIPLAYLFTLSAAYYLTAWRTLERQYAVIAGVMLGVGMWIKPTMGAFMLGMAVMGAVEVIRVRFDLRRVLPRLRVALIAGAAALPLGGAWYIRNWLLGHNPVDFPPGYWQTLAAQSGVEFGWALLALILGLAYLIARRRANQSRPAVRETMLLLVGAALIGAGVISTLAPYWAVSLLAIFPDHTWLTGLTASARRLTVIEWGAVIMGAAFLLAGVWRWWRDHLPESAVKLGWAAALALPYTVVWFFFYSYHYRLSFAVVPLLILPSAVILARWIKPGRMSAAARAAYLAALILLGVPGIVAAVYDPFGGWDYMQTERYPDDMARYRSGNAALLNVVDGLQAWIDEHPGVMLNVAAPGVDRLPFFFPLHPINTDDAPTELEALDQTTYFVYGLPETRGAYQSVPITRNQAVGALNRMDIARRAWGFDDGIFRYDVYELHPELRWIAPEPNGAETRDVVFGGIVRYLGYDVGTFDLGPGRRAIAHTFWQVLAPTDADLSLFIHLRDADGNLITNWDDPIARGELGYYSSAVWDVGEYIKDEREFPVSAEIAAEWVGGTYNLVVGWYDPETNERLPLVIDGVLAGDSHIIENRMVIRLD